MLYIDQNLNIIAKKGKYYSFIQM